jgi:hypothetical protein
MTLRIIGEGLDAVIFACALVRRDLEFEWLIKNDRFGGYFGGGLDCQGKPIDLGMVFLEPNHYGAPQCEISTFRGESGQSARPFINSAYQLLEKMAGDYELVGTKSQDKYGENTTDYFLSDRLFAFKKHAKEIIGELEDRISWLESNPDWHPRFKLNQDSVLFSTNIPDAMRTLYGKSFYNLYFKGYLENCLGELVHKLPASVHRRAWVPLYWPETLLEYLLKDGESEPLFQPVFARFSSMSISEWVFRMIGEIEEYKKKNIILLDDKPDYKNLNIDSKNVYAFLDSSKINSSLSPSVQSPIDSAARITIVHFCCTVPSPSVIFLSDDESGSYRFSLTPGDVSGKGKISIEYGEISAELSDEEILSRSIKLCGRNGIAVDCVGKIHKGKLPFIAPDTDSNCSILSIARNKQTFFSSVATSFNDNIIRAAWAIDDEKRKYRIP